jgi:hypothetical protein
MSESQREDVIMDDNYGMEQVVVPPDMQGPLREWLASCGLRLFRIPVEDDLPTFGIAAVRSPDSERMGA